MYLHLGEELLWASSMPGPLSGDAEVPTARYGSSHIGRMKYVYREGLRHRYGALMQAISGVHFNYSFPAHLWEAYADIRAQRAGDQEQDAASHGYAAGAVSRTPTPRTLCR